MILEAIRQQAQVDADHPVRVRVAELPARQCA
jgi:hypothetical protein